MRKTLLTIFIFFVALITLWQSNLSFEVKKTMANTARNTVPVETQVATFAGGCFWGIEAAFQKYDGVIEAVSGYTGGHTNNPTYEDVLTGKTGHLESVQVAYDPSKISYEDLLEIYWRQIDPTDANGAFVDRGEQYTSAIFYHNNEQKEQALNSKQNLAASGKYSSPIVTKVVEATKFYAAEDYHQDYYDNNPLRAAMVCNNPVKKDFLKKAWGEKIDYKVKPPSIDNTTSEQVSCDDIEAAKRNLTPLQYRVTQEEGIEMPFHNEYWDNKEEGLYVDVVSGKVLFSSKDKFDSGTGWPSFTKPFDDGEIVAKPAIQGRISYSEIRSKTADSHLGHVFEDGPGPNGLRYCINSASLKFIPKDQLEDEGLGQFLGEFE